MLLEIESELLEAIRNCDDILPSEICSEFSEHVLNNYPTVEIAPYSELVFGSKISIHVTRFAKGKGLLIQPHLVAQKIFEWLSKNSKLPCEIFIGESAFINFKISLEDQSAYSNAMLSADPLEYVGAPHKRYLRISKRNKEVQSLDTLFEKELLLRGDTLMSILTKQEFLNSSSYIFLSKLLYLSNEEYDENTVSYIHRYHEVVRQIESLEKYEKHKRSNSIFTDSYYKESLFNALKVQRHFIMVFPFLLFDMYREGKSKPLLQVVSDLVRQTLVSWNNFRLKSALTSNEKFISSEIHELKAGILWTNKICLELENILRY